MPDQALDSNWIVVWVMPKWSLRFRLICSRSVSWRVMWLGLTIKQRCQNEIQQQADTGKDQEGLGIHVLRVSESVNSRDHDTDGDPENRHAVDERGDDFYPVKTEGAAVVGRPFGQKDGEKA